MQDDLDKLVRSVDLVTLLSNYGVELKAQGPSYIACCIWHDDSNPSMSVFEGDDGKWRCHCHSCGTTGDAIDVVECIDGVQRVEAINRLKANHFVRDDTRILKQKEIKPNKWEHVTAQDGLDDFTLPNLTYVAHWTYKNATGALLGYVVRYTDDKGEKSYRPWTFGSYSKNVSPVWKCTTWTSGRRPLYGLDKLAARPTAKVMIVEGEKTADAAQQLMPGMVCVTWPGGSNGFRYVDWTPLTKKNILLVPDADIAGEQAMSGVAGYLLALGCTVRLLDTSCRPLGWDFADALAEGWTSEDIVTFAEDRITPLTSREIEKRIEEEKKTVQSQPLPQPDDLPPQNVLIEGESIRIPDIPEQQPPNVVPIKPHTGIKETSEFNPTDPAQFFSHSNLARLWVEKNPDWIFCNTRKTWLNWDGTRWEIDKRRGINWAVTQEMKEAGTWLESMSLSVKDRRALGNIGNIKSVMEAASYVPGVGRLESDFDKDPWTLGTPGGTVDLKTGVLRESRREDYISKQTRIAPKAGPMPLWDMILDRCSMGNREMRRYYQKWAGYTLSGDASVEGFLVIHGAQNSGKGKFVSTLLEIMDEYAISFQVQLLMENKYGAAGHDVAMFSGARMAVTSEPTSGHRWNEGLIKSLTGRDRQQACRKYENPFEFEPIAKIWLSCNEKPQLTSADGMERRLHVCEFPDTIPEEERILDLPERLKAEYPAILAWAIEGCLLWQKEGLSRPEPVRAAVAEYIDTQDIIADWLGEKTEKCDDWIRQTDLYRSYHDFAKNAGQGALGSVRLGPELEKRGYTHKKSNGIWRWYGLRLAEKIDTVSSWTESF